MQMIIAYIRPIVKDEVAEQLRTLKVPGASLSRVDGFGREADSQGRESYGPQVSPYADMVKLEVVCSDARVEELAEAIADEAQTGRRGDGKVFILPVDRMIDIRTQSWSQQEQTIEGEK
ncbi:transcriptional regulator [Salinibacter sp. 10B]|nr:transcriptional regulator [Salinibacter sp. 10B]